MSFPEYGGMDTGFNPYHGADPFEYDLVVSNSEGGAPRLLELGARRAESLFWGADPEFFSPQPVEKEVDVFFYGYGDKFRRDWMKQMVGEPSRIAPELDFALGGLDFQGDTGAARLLGDVPVQRVRARDLVGARQPEHHAPAARDRPRVLDGSSLRACVLGRRDRLEPACGHRALVRAREASWSLVESADEAVVRVSGAPRRPGAGGGDGAARTRARPRRAHVCAPRAAAARSRSDWAPGYLRDRSAVPRPDRRGRPRLRRVGGDRQGRRRDPRVRSRRSTSSSWTTHRRTTRRRSREAHGAIVLRLPHNVGIGGAVQTGLKFALAEGYDTAVRLDGDGQHDAERAREAARTARARRGRPRDRLPLRRPRRHVPAPARPPHRDPRLRAARLAPRRPAGHRHDLRASWRSTASGSSSSRPSTRTTTRRSRRHSSRSRAVSRLAQVQVDDARARDGILVDHVRPLALLRRQGPARPARRQPPALSALAERSPMTPLRVSIVGVVASAPPHPDRPRARPRTAAEGALRAALARHRCRPAGALRVARGAEHDRRLARRHGLPARGALRGRDALHPPRPAPLLDRAVEADGRERGARAADRAPRGTRVPACLRSRDVRPAEREDVALRVVVEPVRPDADAIPRSGRASTIEVLGLARRRDRHRADEAVDGGSRRRRSRTRRPGRRDPVDAVEDVAAPRPSRRPAEALTRAPCARPRASRPPRSGS